MELSRLVFNLPVHKVGVFRVFFVARAALALAEEAGALVEVFFAAFLIPGLLVDVEAFLAPALAAFLEAAEFLGAMLLTSNLFAGQRVTVKNQPQVKIYHCICITVSVSLYFSPFLIAYFLLAHNIFLLYPNNKISFFSCSPCTRHSCIIQNTLLLLYMQCTG